MKFGGLLSRSKDEKESGVMPESKALQPQNEVSCDTKKLKELITNWTKNEGWEFDDFAEFVKLAKVETPIKLSKLDEKKRSFMCVTASGNEICIELYFGDGSDFCSELRVTEGEVTKRYIINPNLPKGKSVPRVTLQSKTIRRSGKSLECFYCEFFCHRTLKLDDTHTLNIEINEPAASGEKPEISVLRNCEQIEEYLLGLDNAIDIPKVYGKLMEMLEFSKEDISNSEKLLIEYTDTVGGKERVRGKIFLTEGIAHEYAIFVNGETFHVLENGNWNYVSNGGVSISYLEETKQYSISIVDSEDGIVAVSLSEVMNNAKVRISELWKFVK